MLFKIIVFSLGLSLSTFAQNAKESFSVVVEGNRSGLNYIKARSELTMARSTKFCRGSKMPKAIGEWSCKNTAPRLSHCVLEYKCHFVNKKFNRLSESRRLRAKLKDIPHLKTKYSISLFYKDKKEVLEELGGAAQMSRSIKKMPAPFAPQKLAASKSVSRKKKVRGTRVQKAPLKKSVVPTKKKSVSERELEEIAFLKDDEVDKLIKQEELIEEEEVSAPIESESVAKDDKIDFSEIKKEKKKESKSNLKTQWASFDLSYIMISDDEETSLSTFGLSWTPHLWFSSHFGVRGNIGFHSYSTPETELVASESFLIYDLGLFGVYKFTNIFFELGLGLQKWNHEEAENANTLSYGFGYYFDEKKLYIIDRVSFGMSSLSNDIGTKEMKFSIGGSF
ncbi:hypothetical protein [Halobacteriovorax sp. JY17]|uniref:hypothetical protein n=1 Tax=Halobacteriovorax sp. JY17 TaxID=2014617 RepID=UPI0025BB8F61|nr:hypothetical protein [Halobacteriovorax sp. JY17]